jgi:hypothetical protein
MDSSDASNVYITVWTKLQHILLWLGENTAGISETRGCQRKPLQNILMP